MLPFLAAVLAGAVSGVGAADVDSSNLSGVFQATCLDGQAKLRAGDVTPISYDQLPEALRTSLGRPASGKVWRLNAAGSSYLYMLDYNAGPGISPKVCGLASDAMDGKAAGDMLEARVTGGVARSRPRTAQWLNARDGYVATATTASKFKVLQINWMSEADKEIAQQQVEQLPR
ncbi:MAG TPA: hypothetical protein VF079_04425 [Sphingomicrobium sp.]